MDAQQAAHAAEVERLKEEKNLWERRALDGVVSLVEANREHDNLNYCGKLVAKAMLWWRGRARRMRDERDAAVRERDAAVEALRTVVGSSSHVEAINIAGRALIFTTTSPSQHTGIDQPSDPYSGELGNINLRMLATKMHAALGLLKRQGCYHPGMDSMREEGFKHGLNVGDRSADASATGGEREPEPYIPEPWGGPEGE